HGSKVFCAVVRGLLQKIFLQLFDMAVARSDGELILLTPFHDSIESVPTAGIKRRASKTLTARTIPHVVNSRVEAAVISHPPGVNGAQFASGRHVHKASAFTSLRVFIATGNI